MNSTEMIQIPKLEFKQNQNQDPKIINSEPASSHESYPQTPFQIQYPSTTSGTRMSQLYQCPRISEDLSEDSKPSFEAEGHYQGKPKLRHFSSRNELMNIRQIVTLENSNQNESLQSSDHVQFVDIHNHNQKNSHNLLGVRKSNSFDQRYSQRQKKLQLMRQQLGLKRLRIESMRLQNQILLKNQRIQKQTLGQQNEQRHIAYYLLMVLVCFLIIRLSIW